MLEVMKKVAQQTNEFNAPAKVMFGEVVTSNPLTVQVDNRFTIDADMLTVFKGASFATGAKLVLLRDQGGQRFVVLGEVD